MAHELILTVKIKFNDSVDFDDEATQEIVNNVAAALSYHANEVGITPDGYENYVQEIEVSEKLSQSIETVQVG